MVVVDVLVVEEFDYCDFVVGWVVGWGIFILG